MELREILPDGVVLDQAAATRVMRYAEELLSENARVNLTGAKTLDALLRVHVADSLALLPLLDAETVKRALDLGTGGGLPGALLAAALPGATWTLLDATRKKVNAVARALTGARIANARALWGRAERVSESPAFRGQMDLVTARAVAPLAALAPLAAALLHAGGKAWFFKTESAVAAELPEAEPVIARCGLRISSQVAYTLRGEHAGRMLLGLEATR